MKPITINGTNIYHHEVEDQSKAIAKRIGSEFVFLALFNQIDHLDLEKQEAIILKIESLIDHEHGERRKHQRKIGMSSHFRMVTNALLKYMHEELKLSDTERDELLSETIFCIIQPKSNYGQGLIFNKGMIVNNEEHFSAIETDRPSYLNYVEDFKAKHWYKPKDNLFFLNDLKTLTLMASKAKLEDVNKSINGGSKYKHNGFIRLNYLQ